MAQKNTVLREVEAYFRSQGCICKIPEDAGSRAKCINLKTIRPAQNGSPALSVTYAVRTDKWIEKSGNLYLEKQHMKKNVYGKFEREQGFFEKMRADILLCFDPDSRHLFAFDWKLISRFVAEHENDPDCCTYTESPNKYMPGVISGTLILKVDRLREEGALLSVDAI